MFRQIFTPFKIGTMEIPNRLVVPAMVVNYCTVDGMATEKFIAYHEAKAKGGWGLIITENIAVDPTGKAFTNIPGLWNDSQIDGYKELTNRIHRHGTKIIAQIYHAGRQTNRDVIACQPVAPSAIPCPLKQEMPRELTADEIHDLVEKFGDCALRAKKAGFDGVEIHGAHGYLIAQFLSLYSNKRTDEFGGSLMNRLRFALDIIKDIRLKVGKDFPLIFRISGDELVPGGLKIEDTKAIAMILEKAGVNALHVSAGVNEANYGIIPPAPISHGWITNLAAEVKRVVGIPVITVGRINDPFLAEAILASGKADLVGMGRASLADPELPKKAASGRLDEIVYCIGCMQGCAGMISGNKPATCLVNPTLGNEEVRQIKPAASKKKVLVAGGGPAGAEAAIIAARRGHDVYLYEKSNRIGGQLNLAAIPPNKGEIATFIAWQENQLRIHGVTVHLNTEVTKEIVNLLKPDAVIVATGSKPADMSIPGIDRANVVTAHDVLSGKIVTGHRVAIVGGGMVGAETAAHLANYGREVTIVEKLPEIAQNVQSRIRYFLLKELAEKGVRIYINSLVRKVIDGSLIIDRAGTEEKIGPFNTVIMAIGVTPERDLAINLEGKVNEIIIVGDALQARTALEAVEEGFVAGMTV